MPGRSGLLGEFEEVVLLAVCQVDGDVYAVPVHAELEARLGRELSMGAVYATLDRLDHRGLLTSRVEDGLSGRGGRPRRLFAPTAEGFEALRVTARLRGRMWEGVTLPDAASG